MEIFASDYREAERIAQRMLDEGVTVKYVETLFKGTKKFVTIRKPKP